MADIREKLQRALNGATWVTPRFAENIVHINGIQVNVQLWTHTNTGRLRPEAKIQFAIRGKFVYSIEDAIKVIEEATQ